MIIVRIKGGLGNQLFQYAFANSLSRKIGQTNVRLDISWFNSEINFSHQKLHLDKFKTEYKKANISDIVSVLPLKFATSRIGETLYSLLPAETWFVTHRLADWVYSTGPTISQEYLNYCQDCRKDNSKREPFKYTYSPAVYEMGLDMVFDGHWQAKQYPESVSDKLYSELQVQSDPRGKNKELLREIEQDTAVSVHFRRGDYVELGNALSWEYYECAFDRIKSVVSSPEFYFFSDDPQAVRENVNLEADYTLVDHNDGETPHEDLRLMSHCDHNIIANSTFSWWGAWLNQNDSKTVIAPSIWLGHDVNDIDILPDAWQTIPV